MMTFMESRTPKIALSVNKTVYRGSELPTNILEQMINSYGLMHVGNTNIFWILLVFLIFV